ncbi:unannotated protein [freshwater metagenome]|uniref:Unannotated protein n=1 Tax=freshwater metagenome TaxID=449393 RepID=A0A6J6FDC0_9ZZZZ
MCTKYQVSYANFWRIDFSEVMVTTPMSAAPTVASAM